MKGKTKQNINPDKMDSISYQLGSIYNAIIELKTTIEKSQTITKEDLKEYLELLKEEGLIEKTDKEEQEDIALKKLEKRMGYYD